MKNLRSFTIIAITLLSLCACSKKDTDDLVEIPNNFITIPDSAFEEELIAQGIDSDGIVNQRLLKEDAKAITKLDIYNFYITDISGIEGFVNLDELYINGTGIQTIDVSKNVLLKDLWLYGNELKEIHGVASLERLKYLDLTMNYFEEFTLENSSIERLLMSNNELTQFDASGAENLKILNINGNNLTSVDLSQNTLIEAVALGGNAITQLNFGTAANLTYIECFSNNLSSLDVSNFPNLQVLSANRNPNLTCIKIAESQIMELRLSDYQQAKPECN